MASILPVVVRVAVLLLVAPAALAQMPSPVVLAERVEQVRLSQKVLPTVVITEDPRSYVEAIAGWRRDVRYPVLYDDGSARSAQRIGMFCRAFEPTRVVRYVASDTTWDEKEEPRRLLIESAVCSAWGVRAEDTRALLAYFEGINWKAPGVVVSSLRDRSWTGAMAAAAGRGQPICWVVAPRNVNGAMTEAEADALCTSIELFCARTGLTWRNLGDDLEAVTIALNCPVKIRREATDDHVATSDRVGRLITDDEGESRWAWAGQIIGDESESAYRAMCALFLSVDQAWLFDGYDDDPNKVWHHWDATEASSNLALRNVQSTLHDTPNQSIDIWRLASTRPVEAGLMLINSSGSATSFNLRPGKGYAGDMPILSEPVAVHIVHSWSAVRPGARLTIAGRLLERGAFAYCGSVEEPFLEAFVPTPAVAGRLMAPAPFGAAVRHDRYRLWKIAVLGDPLYTFGPHAPRQDGDITALLESATDLGTVEMRDLVRLGRDEEASTRLLERSMSGALTPDEARDGAPALFRTGRLQELEQAFRVMRPDDREMMADYAWLASRRPTVDLSPILKDLLRTGQIAADAVELARRLPRAEAITLLSDARARVRREADLQLIDRALREMR